LLEELEDWQLRSVQDPIRQLLLVQCIVITVHHSASEPACSRVKNLFKTGWLVQVMSGSNFWKYLGQKYHFEVNQSIRTGITRIGNILCFLDSFYLKFVTQFGAMVYRHIVMYITIQTYDIGVTLYDGM
jgi:hypothetical protein